MDWGQRISDILFKTTKTLGFLRRDLAFASGSTKEVAYRTLVRRNGTFTLCPRRPRQSRFRPPWTKRGDRNTT